MIYDSRQLFKNVEFISHGQERTPYLAQNISFQEIKSLKEKIENKIGKNLKNRGEAHITVITPPEYEVLKEKLSMTAIDELASIAEIQQIPFEVLCLGRGQYFNKNEDETFFIVVKSQRLLELRKKIKDTFVKSGGDNFAFNPEVFFPHITVGYTNRDLHFQDGIVKDTSSCFIALDSK